MAPTTPLLLIDNVFDTVGLYPAATLTASSEVVGHEGFRVADYRRDRTYWQTPAAGGDEYVKVDLGSGNTRAVDSIFIDRGHNLWSIANGVGVQRSDDGSTWTLEKAFAVPASTVVGGDPTSSTLAVTEEGALWAIFTKSAAHRYWRFLIGTGFAPSAIVPGLILGLRTQLLGYSTTFDEDAGQRTQTSQQSTAGYRATDTTYAWRTVTLGLSLIGATEYDATIRSLRDLLFAKNQPAVVFMDYGTRPERGWMYQLDGTSWAMAKQRVYRSGQITFREVGQGLG